VKNLDFLTRLQQNIRKLETLNGQTVVSEGQRIGPGLGTGANLVKGTTVSPTDEEAKVQEGFENSVLGEGVDPAIPKEELDGIITKYVENIVDDLLKDI
jgi:hypothetical protein